MTDTSPLYPAGPPLVFMLLFLLFFLAWLGGIAFWIYCIVDVARIPEHQFRAVGSEKTPWLLVVVLASFIGALIWFFTKRRDVHRAGQWAPAGLAAPAGWYRDPYSGGFRWWDGVRWTEGYQLPQPPQHSA